MFAFHSLTDADALNLVILRSLSSLNVPHWARCPLHAIVSLRVRRPRCAHVAVTSEVSDVDPSYKREALERTTMNPISILFLVTQNLRARGGSHSVDGG